MLPVMGISLIGVRVNDAQMARDSVCVCAWFLRVVERARVIMSERTPNEQYNGARMGMESPRVCVCMCVNVRGPLHQENARAPREAHTC